MRLDRVLIDIYEWFRKILWAEKQEESAGYQIILTKTNIDSRPILGVLQLIGRNTPRAVRTWRFLPHRERTPEDRQYDILLCLDSLERLANEHSERGITDINRARSRYHTHRLTVLRLAHFLGPDGEFEADELFSDTIALRGRTDGRSQL